MPEAKEYTIKIVYCDNRPVKIKKVTALFPPDNRRIETFREAVPRYDGELNVCEIQVID